MATNSRRHIDGLERPSYFSRLPASIVRHDLVVISYGQTAQDIRGDEDVHGADAAVAQHGLHAARMPAAETNGRLVLIVARHRQDGVLANDSHDRFVDPDGADR